MVVLLALIYCHNISKTSLLIELTITTYPVSRYPVHFASHDLVQPIRERESNQFRWNNNPQYTFGTLGVREQVLGVGRPGNIFQNYHQNRKYLFFTILKI